MSDISRDRTLPASFYFDEDIFDHFRQTIFRRSWHYAGSIDDLTGRHNLVPLEVLPDYIGEPLVKTKDRAGNVSCLSNVCTHRGSLLVDEPSNGALLRCPYHGRCFGFDGKFRSMPGFEGVENFPTAEDDLLPIDMEVYGPMQFVRLQGTLDFRSQFEVLFGAMKWRDPKGLELRPEASRVYHVNAHWCLYIDNYLEGFHVPFVHPGLNDALDVPSYHVECHPNSVLQIGYADDAESSILSIPEGLPYSGQRIYAMYWWIYPNIMFNFYPWGISLNVVEPVSMDFTRIRFETYTYKDLETPDVSGIHLTELEDERIVEMVQKGIRSSHYRQGRYSVQHERGVHHFHTMLRNHLTE